jgi:hypothetical protein
MSRRSSLALFTALTGIAMFAEDRRIADQKCTDASPGRRDRTPEQSQARISARQERMARKLARRAQRATAQAPGGDGDA